MDLTLDAALRERVLRVRELGRTQMRPLGLEADRLGRPVPPDHPFFELLVRLGLGRTRWSGEENLARAATGGGGVRAVVALAEEMSYWDRGVAVAFPGPGLGEARGRHGPPLHRLAGQVDGPVLHVGPVADQHSVDTGGERSGHGHLEREMRGHRRHLQIVGEGRAVEPAPGPEELHDLG